MFFNQIEMAPPDAILGLTEAFRKDPRPVQVNLGVGVFVDEQGTTPVLECVKRAERVLWETEKTKGYTPIPGPPEFGAEDAGVRDAGEERFDGVEDDPFRAAGPRCPGCPTHASAGSSFGKYDGPSDIDPAVREGAP